MIIALLAVTVAWTAWCVWAEKNPPKPTVQPQAPTPVEVEWDEQTDSVEDKRRMLDQIFERHVPNDDDVDPPTVVADRR